MIKSERRSYKLMTKKLFCPSLMCANFTQIKTEVKALEEANIDIFHMDVMDGSFVPNLALGLEDYKTVRKLTKKPMDVHLMVQNPKNFVPIFAKAGADIIYIHPEADQMPTSTLKDIADRHIHPGIAISPGTSLPMIRELLSLVDYVLVMTVNPGFAGQKFLEYTLGKIRDLSRLKSTYNYHLMVDGAISPERIDQLSYIGVDGFILGTSALFGKEHSYKEILDKLKETRI